MDKVEAPVADGTGDVEAAVAELRLHNRLLPAVELHDLEFPDARAADERDPAVADEEIADGHGLP